MARVDRFEPPLFFFASRCGLVLVIALDTETTGLGRDREDAIVEVAFAYRAPATREVETWSRLCHPGDEFLAEGRAAEALRINRIAEADVRAAPPAREVAVELRRELRALARRDEVSLVAFNASFDQAFLAKPPWRVLGPWGSCLKLEATRALNPGRRWLKLDEACAALRVQVPGSAHRAARDAHAALLVHEALASALPA